MDRMNVTRSLFIYSTVCIICVAVILVLDIFVIESVFGVYVRHLGKGLDVSTISAVKFIVFWFVKAVLYFVFNISLISVVSKFYIYEELIININRLIVYLALFLICFLAFLYLFYTEFWEMAPFSYLVNIIFYISTFIIIYKRSILGAGDHMLRMRGISWSVTLLNIAPFVLFVSLFLLVGAWHPQTYFKILYRFMWNNPVLFIVYSDVINVLFCIIAIKSVICSVTVCKK